MKLRRLILLPSDEDKRTSGSALEGENGPDWDLLTEVDRLRTTSSGLSAEVQGKRRSARITRAVSEQRVRVEELERENAIAHSNCQMLERRLLQTEERAAELEELVEVLRAQRDRLQTYYEQQKDRADGLDSACAAVRDAAGELLAASDRQTHAALGTRGLARAKVEYADALAGLRRALDRNAGRDFLAPDVANDVRRLHVGKSCRGREEEAFAEHRSGAQHGRLEPQSQLRRLVAGVRRSRTDARRDAVRAHSAGERRLDADRAPGEGVQPGATVGPWPTWAIAVITPRGVSAFAPLVSSVPEQPSDDGAEEVLRIK